MAAKGFELNVQNSLTAIKRLSHTDSVSAVMLSNEAAVTLHAYMATLARIHAVVPGDMQSVIQHAMQISLSEFSDDDNSFQGSDDGKKDQTQTSPSITTTVSAPTATSTPTVILPTVTEAPTLTPQPTTTFLTTPNDDSSENTGNTSDDNNDSDSVSDTDDDNDDDDDDDDDNDDD